MAAHLDALLVLRDAAVEAAAREEASTATETCVNSKEQIVPETRSAGHSKSVHGPYEDAMHERQASLQRTLRKQGRVVAFRHRQWKGLHEQLVQARLVAAAVFDMEDALETILFFCDRRTLSRAKAVTRRWAYHARVQFRSPLWQSRHLTLSEMLTEWRPRKSWPSDEAVIRRLRLASFDERSTKDGDGRTLLHLALSRPFHPRSHEVVVALIKACPLLVTVADEEGRLPLHYAAAAAVRVETIETLVWSCPDSADRKDKKGHFPVTAALRGLCSSTVDKCCVLLAAMSEEALEGRGPASLLPRYEGSGNLPASSRRENKQARVPHLGQGAIRMMAEFLWQRGLLAGAPKWLLEAVPQE